MSGPDCTCTKCGATKPRAEFSPVRRKKNPDGVSSWCRECHRAANRAHSLAQRESLRRAGARSTAVVGAGCAERFWSKVDRSGGPDACWPWTGAVDGKGYGRFNIAGHNIPAHRVALALAGRDPGDACGLHSCDNPPCCNAAHLVRGTLQDNNRHIAERGRRIGRAAKVPEGDIDAVLARLAAGETQTSVAATYGVHPSTISHIASGHRRRRVQPSD